jgi:hypothetical protein
MRLLKAQAIVVWDRFLAFFDASFNALEIFDI